MQTCTYFAIQLHSQIQHNSIFLSPGRAPTPYLSAQHLSNLHTQMRNSIPATSVFLLLHVILFGVFLQSTQCSNFSTDESGNLIEEICKQTPLYDLCLSALLSNPQSSKTDVKGLARIMADTLLANAAEALNYIEGLIKQSPEPEVERSLAYCAELYIPVVKYTLPQAIDALTNGQYKFANFGISDAAKEANACEKKFSGPTKSPLSDWNNLVENLSDVAVAIVNILIEG